MWQVCTSVMTSMRQKYHRVGDLIWFPASETTYEDRHWIEFVLYLLTLFFSFWLFLLVLSPLYPVPSPPDIPYYRFLNSETLLITTACSCHFLCHAWQNWTCFWILCSMSYRCVHMEWWIERKEKKTAVTVVAIPSQPALLMWLCVSAARPSLLSPRAILRSWHPADYISPILVRKLSVSVFPATAIPNRLLRFRVFESKFGVLREIRKFGDA